MADHATGTLLDAVLAEDEGEAALAEDAVLAEDELLVEEISIDGMCGVY
jgi:mycofactocin precursor